MSQPHTSASDNQTRKSTSPSQNIRCHNLLRGKSPTQIACLKEATLELLKEQSPDPDVIGEVYFTVHNDTCSSAAGGEVGEAEARRS